MPGITLCRLRQRINTKKKRRSSDCPTPDTDVMPVCIEHYDDTVTTKREVMSEASVNDAPVVISCNNSIPLKAYSTVNYFEPSVEENNVDAHTCACDNLQQAYGHKEIPGNKRSDSFRVIEINLNNMDDVSDIESLEPLFREERNNVCFQVFNEGLCATDTNSNHPSNQMDDNDIISLPHLSVVTPDDREKSRGRNTSIRRRHKIDDSFFQSYVEDSYNDIIQKLSDSTKECGLTDTLDDIRNGLFQ